MTRLVVELSQYGEADCSWHPSVVVGKIEWHVCRSLGA